jgi:putative flippase GtrA
MRGLAAWISPARHSAHASRVIKFAFVGAIGICVQLLTLSTLTRAGMNYLLATAISVELTVLHNFCWHRRFTWDDRAAIGGMVDAHRLFRFHLSNGAISLFGNVVLMAVLVGKMGLALVVANSITVALCAGANFFLSDLWVFQSNSGAMKFQRRAGGLCSPDISPISKTVRCAKGT